MTSLVKFAKSFIVPKVIIDTLNNQNPTELGRDSGIALRRVITNEIGKKAYLTMDDRVISWLDAYYVAFRREMYGIKGLYKGIAKKGTDGQVVKR